MNSTEILNTQSIKRFVRETLGCTCPDKVFEHIRCVDHSELLTSARMVYAIGERLFVAVIVPVDWRDIKPGLAQLVDTAVSYRDQHGYHRIRLVIATDDNAFDELESAFHALLNKDDRVHLHVISPEQLPVDAAVKAVE